MVSEMSIHCEMSDELRIGEGSCTVKPAQCRRAGCRDAAEQNSFENPDHNPNPAPAAAAALTLTCPWPPPR